MMASKLQPARQAYPYFFDNHGVSLACAHYQLDGIRAISHQVPGNCVY